MGKLENCCYSELISSFVRYFRMKDAREMPFVLQPLNVM